MRTTTDPDLTQSNEFDEVTPDGTLTYCANIDHPNGVTRSQYLEPASVAGFYDLAGSNTIKSDESLHIYECVDDLNDTYAVARTVTSASDVNPCFYDSATMSMPYITLNESASKHGQPLMVSNPLYSVKTESEQN